MAEEMNLDQINFQERINSGTSWTKNEQFDKDGYLNVMTRLDDIINTAGHRISTAAME